MCNLFKYFPSHNPATTGKPAKYHDATPDFLSQVKISGNKNYSVN